MSAEVYLSEERKAVIMLYSLIEDGEENLADLFISLIPKEEQAKITDTLNRMLYLFK